MMEERYLLWLYLFSAAWSVFLWSRRRDTFPPRTIVPAALTGAAAAAGLFVPSTADLAFPVATAGFVLFLLLPGLLVRCARGAARLDRLGLASALLGAARLLFPVRFLLAEQQLYRTARREPDGPARAALRRWLDAQEAEAVPTGGVPATAILAVSFVVVHAVAMVVGGAGGPSSLLTLLELGASYGPRIRDGDLFRLFTAMFLHVGLLHLAMNLLAVWIVGHWIEPGLGSLRTLLLFLLGGLLGNLASLFFVAAGPDAWVSAGASGGAMALIGGALVLALRSPPSLVRGRRIQSLAVIIAATILLGVVEEGIDNGAHLGGLAAGALLALPLTGPRRISARIVRPAALLLVAAALSAFVWMLTALPEWSVDRDYRGPGYFLRAPAFLAQNGSDYDGGVLGAIRIEMMEAGGDPRGIAGEELDRLERDSSDLPEGVEIRRAGPASRGRWEGGTLRLEPARGSGPVSVWVLKDRPGERTAVIRIRLGDDDPRLAARMMDPVLESFAFE